MNIRFDDDVKGNLAEFQAWFRHLHANPELAFQEFHTTAFIKGVLDKLDHFEIIQVCETGVIGILRGAHDGPAIGLRADIDALPIVEDTDLEYKSHYEGVMHACGHDGHTAALLGAAYVLNNYVSKLHGTVYFIFQAGEEKQPGGAIEIVDSGVLDSLQYIFGQHLIPSVPTGKVAMRVGTVTGASDRFYLTIEGKGGHPAFPHLTVDPVVIAAEIIMALQTIVSRKTQHLYNPVISITLINTPPGADNVIPNSIDLVGSVRNISEAVRGETEQWIERLCSGIASAHGAAATLNYVRGYNPLVVDEAPYEVVLAAARDFLPKSDIIIMPDPIPAGEDFGNYGAVAEIAYYLIGTANAEKGTTASPHNPKYIADPDSLYYGTMMHLNVVKELLMQG